MGGQTGVCVQAKGVKIGSPHQRLEEARKDPPYSFGESMAVSIP